MNDPRPLRLKPASADEPSLLSPHLALDRCQHLERRRPPCDAAERDAHDENVALERGGDLQNSAASIARVKAR